MWVYASFSIAVLIAFTGGRPGMISAATAATAVLMITLVKDHGLEYLLAATVFAGLLQIGAGLLKLGRFMRYVSKSVMTGFVNALAILIFMAQLPQLMDVTWVTYAMVAGGLAIIYLLPKLTTAVPSPLVAIIVVGAILASPSVLQAFSMLGNMASAPLEIVTLQARALPSLPTYLLVAIIALEVYQWGCSHKSEN